MSHLEFLSFVTFWVVELCHISSFMFKVFEFCHFYFLRFWVVKFWVFSLVTFLVLSYSDFCHICSFFLMFCHILSLQVLRNFEFLSFVKFWFFWWFFSQCFFGFFFWNFFAAEKRFLLTKNCFTTVTCTCTCIGRYVGS